MSSDFRLCPKEPEERAMRIILLALLVSHLSCLALGWYVSGLMLF